MIFTVKNIIWSWPDKFQDIVFKSTKASDISNFDISRLFHSVTADGKKNFWGKDEFYFSSTMSL